MAFVSAASLWEAEIKTTSDAASSTSKPSPPHHNDPFDRMLIAQAMVDNLCLVTADQIMGRYEVAGPST
ncbi:MAG TPA: hypothetical protein VFZ70_04040 [Euzebyales bacterium]